VRDTFGRGVVLTGIRIGGARAVLLACDCGPDVLYAARVTDLVSGRVVSCGHCRHPERMAGRAARRDEAARRAAEAVAENAAREAAGAVLAAHGFRVTRAIQLERL